MIDGIQRMVAEFYQACEKDDWEFLARQARTTMAQQELRNFGFGGTPRSKADKLFYQPLVLPAIRLEETYAFYEFDHPRILSLMELIDWVTSTHQGTLKSRQSNKIKAAQKAREGKPISADSRQNSEADEVGAKCTLLRWDLDRTDIDGGDAGYLGVRLARATDRPAAVSVRTTLIGDVWSSRRGQMRREFENLGAEKRGWPSVR